jgi:two-component system NtrC family sensor kinase
MKKYLETLLNDVSKSPLIDQGDLNAASELILQAVIEGLKVDRSGIWLYVENLAGIRCFLLKDSLLDVPKEEVVLNRSEYPRYFSALEEARVIVANDASTASETSEFAVGYLDELGISSMLDTPIRHSGKTVGIICTEHRGQARTWGDDEIVFAGVLSDLFGRAISAREKLDYERKLVEANKNLEIMVESRTAHLNKTISELTSLQSKLVESEKMAALGNMVAGIAHEVNTPLGVALTATSFLKGSIKKISGQIENKTLTQVDMVCFLSDINEAADLTISNLDRAATLVENFKRTSADMHHFDQYSIRLKTYIKQTLYTLTPMTKKLNVQVNVTGPEIELMTFPGAISQVITNLVANSCTHGFSIDNKRQAKITIKIEICDDRLCVYYSDNGVGMDLETSKKMFDPFFTTSRGAGGTGLGLSIVHTLLTKKLNADVTVSSIVGEGTEFKIYFPITKPNKPKSLTKPLPGLP